MTGTAQDQKKAYRIISQCKTFFPWYRSQLADKYDLQAFNDVQTAILPELERYTDAGEMVEDRQKFADKTLIIQIITKADRMRRTDPEAIKERKS